MKNTLPIDYFYNNFEIFAAKNFGSLPVSDGYVENIRRAIADIRNSHIALGYALIAYAESHTFGYGSCNLSYRDCRSEVFFARCFQQFELDKSSVSRHVNVVYRFGDGKGGLRSVYRDKSFSFLVELLPLDERQIDHCLMYSTVADIRKYKAELAAGLKEPKPVATSQQLEISDSEQSVATSQQQNKPVNFYCAIVIPPSDLYPHLARYDRFRGKSVQDLCNNVIELEKLNSELIAKLDNLNNAPLNGATEVSFKGIPMLGRDSLLEQSVLSRIVGVE